MPTVKAVNVTKYDAGGSGDNIVEDGYIKTVEKVWIDTYTYSSAKTIGANLALVIAEIPESKKITGISVNVAGMDTVTTSTLTIGLMNTAGVTNSTIFQAAVRCGGSTELAAGSGKVTWINASSANLPYVCTGGTNKVIVTFLASSDVTSGTIYSVVRYT